MSYRIEVYNDRNEPITQARATVYESESAAEQGAMIVSMALPMGWRAKVVPYTPEPQSWSDDRPMFTCDSAPSSAEQQESGRLNRELTR